MIELFWTPEAIQDRDEIYDYIEADNLAEYGGEFGGNLRMNPWKLIFWIAIATVTIGSLLPIAYLPPQAFNIWDKAQHTTAFVALGTLGLISYSSRAVRVVLGLLIYGGLIELGQTVTGWRYGDRMDWVADAVGVVVAYAVWSLWTWSKTEHRKHG
jgi:VanZ family protein